MRILLFTALLFSTLFVAYQTPRATTQHGTAVTAVPQTGGDPIPVCPSAHCQVGN